MEEFVYLEDIYPPNSLYAAIIRSPIAKGSLKSILLPVLPENYFFITAANIPGENRLEDTNIPILADRILSYIGEPIALLVGQDKTVLEEFISLCKIETDEEKPVFSYEQNSSDDLSNITAVREIKSGEPEKYFSHLRPETSQTGEAPQEAAESAAKIISGNYVTGIQDHWYAEPGGAVTWYENVSNNKPEENIKNIKKSTDKDLKNKKTSDTPQANKLIVKTATQWPYHVKRSVSRTLGIDPSLVSVEPTSLSLHMDGKLVFSSLIACRAALGTYIAKKPVRLILDREEDFLYSPKRFKSNIDIKTAIDENGKILAADIVICVNLGAFGINSDEILDQVCIGVLGYYNIKNIKLTAKAFRTNIPPQGPFSGFGLAQGLFAMECHVSHIADSLHLDPAQWRKPHLDYSRFTHLYWNTKREGDNDRKSSQGSQKNQGPIEDLIDRTALMSDYNRKWASNELLRKYRKDNSLVIEKGENPRGIGIALGFQGSGLLYNGDDKGNYSVEITLTKESILEIRASITSNDGNYEKIWAKVASQIISIEPENVRVISNNAPDCGPSCASRNITSVTRLIEKCCQVIRKQRFHDPLPITVRRAMKSQSGLLWNGLITPPAGKVINAASFSKFGLACAVVEVTIDMIECIPKIRGIWLGIDGGKIISINRSKRSLVRGATQALGWAYTENIEYVNGILSKSCYENYTIPTAEDIPPIYPDFVPNDTGESRGIGELPFTCIPAAFIQAVSQALDYNFKSIPLNRKEIWNIIHNKKNETPAQGAK
ncbi:MAG: xanthine dehydrogenase family protein molybdopterin-binding subunit [Treponema sp.]|nr:xanthine dehydrogenase family protein molybdopterin-binding subunit [Treponema sp.]